MSWRVANSLNKLLAQINADAPKRSKASDGSIGDAAHASRSSDHNPWVKLNGQGIVTARDFTNDPGDGFDSSTFADRLRLEAKAGREKRVKYIISDGRIASAKTGWNWARYTGPNGHYKHVHVSVVSTAARFDSTAAWSPALFGKAVSSKPVVDKISVSRVRSRALDFKAGRKVAFSDDVRDVQSLLNGASFLRLVRPLKQDGYWGKRTEIAYARFEKKQGYKAADGIPDAKGAGLRRLAALVRSKRPVVK